MSLGRKEGSKQIPMWVPHDQIARSPGHPFYQKLNELLKEDGFDAWVEELCEPYLRKGGRPSIPPGVYFRMLMVGYFGGVTPERGIAWRCADSLSLRQFLGMGMTESTPDHSTLSIWRQRLAVKTYEAVFRRVLGIVERYGLLDGSTLGVDSSPVEADAAMKSIRRKDSRESYRVYLKRLAAEAGVEGETAEVLTRFELKRKGKKVSNKDWEFNTDPEARITRMKDGTTHLAYKAENAVDLKEGVVVAGRVTYADEGDTRTVRETLREAKRNLKAASRHRCILEAVADKGYHETELIRELNQDDGITTYIPEGNPQQRRRWDGDIESCRAFHGDRTRCRGERGKALGRRRATLVERAFAHLLETGGLRRFRLRGLDNVQKRYLGACTRLQPQRCDETAVWVWHPQVPAGPKGFADSCLFTVRMAPSCRSNTFKPGLNGKDAGRGIKLS